MSSRFLNTLDLETIRRRVDAGQEPWAAAAAHLLSTADAALEQPPVNIRENGGSPHFRQDAVYVPGQDGVRNRESNMKSGDLARQASSATLNLALAWCTTGQTRYADKALEFIHTWCIDQDTRMFPTGRMVDPWTPGAAYGGDIILFAASHNMFLAGHLLADYPGWKLSSHAAVKRWTRNMLDPQRELMFFQGREMYNNWEDARLLYLATGALLLDDLDLLLNVFDRWCQILPLKMTDQGELPRETMRTRSMHYTLFALDSSLQVAEIARRFGVDLYDYTVNGRGIKKALDYATHFLMHMDEWKFQMIEPLGGGEHTHMGLFEMAYARWPDRKYLEVLNAYGGRPVTAGHATLLYARGS